MADDKYANSKCFVFSPDGYEEITYSELCRRRDIDTSYQAKRFIPLHGMLLEVTEADYIAFYKAKRRQKYLDERSEENGDISIDMLTTDEFNGADILVDDSDPIADQVIHSMMLDKLHACLLLLSVEEQALIHDLFYTEMTEREIAAKHGVSQVAIHKRKKRILAKLKKFMD